MSLQVWLPLNGDLRNQGLTNITVTNNGATINVAGKIGSCYAFDGTDDYITITNLNCANWAQISISCWCYPTTDFNYLFLIRGSGAHRVRISGDGLMFRDTNNSSQRIVSFNQAIPQNTWSHITCIYNRGEITMYINGIQTAHSTAYYHNNSTLMADLNEIRIARQQSSSGNNYYNGKLNDFRIYDHALSQKEVEEIAKGLVLHYKLDDPYIESTSILSCSITETAYNSVISKYGYNDDSNLSKTVGNFQGKDCVKIGTRVAGETARPYAYFGNLFTSDGTNAPAYKALSFDYYTTVPTTTWLNIYKLGSGEGTALWKTTNSDGTFSGIYTNSANNIIVKPNEWNHIEVVFHGTTAANAEWGYCINGPNHTTSPDYYFLYANIQLEENDHVTGYGGNFHNNIIYDSSGYNNNGTPSNLTLINEVSRYSYGIKFSGSSSYAKCNNAIFAQNAPEMTLNFWVKNATRNNGAKGKFFSCTESGGFNVEAGNSGYLRFPIYVCTNSAQTTYAYKYDSNEIQIAALPANEWVMLTFVYNTEGTKTYINGQLHHTYTNTSYGIRFNTSARFYLGCEASGANPSSPYYDGQMSDFRWYYTVLSPEQILELYNTSATIDNNGNIHARELVEI